MSKNIRFKGIVATLAQIAADAFAGRISWASDLARPVHYYTDSDYAVLARKDVAETFPEVKITNQAGPVARMVQAGTDGSQSAVSAATARSTIGAQEALGYTPVNKAGDTMTGALTLSAGDLNVGAGAIQTASTTRISNGGAGTLTSLVNSATAGVGVRPKVALADGTDSVQDAATFRGTIGAVAASEKGAANGVAPLGADSKIASTYLPSYVDDVLEFASLASFPATGESGKIYVAINTAKTYRWSGSAYVVISETLALGETSSTAYRGDRGKTAFDHSQATWNPHGTTFAQIASTPTTLEGYGITDAQVALGYTPANRAGDTFTGQVVVTDPTNVVAQPKLLVSVGGGSESGEVGFHSDGASEGNKNWGAGVSRDLSCFRIMSYTDDWSVRTECIRVGTDYLDLSNAYANALAVGYKIGGLKVVGGRKIGWAAPTGTATRTTFATSTVTLPQLAERLKALIDDLTAHGLIGP